MMVVHRDERDGVTSLPSRDVQWSDPFEVLYAVYERVVLGLSSD